MTISTEHKALRIAQQEGGIMVADIGIGNAHDITKELCINGFLKEFKVPKGTTDPEHSHYYKITKKGKKELKEMEMTPRSKETLEKRRRTIQLKKEREAMG